VKKKDDTNEGTAGERWEHTSKTRALPLEEGEQETKRRAVNCREPEQHESQTSANRTKK